MSPAVAFVLIALGVILIIVAILLFIEGYKKQKTNRLLKKGDRTTPTYLEVQRETYLEVQRDRCAKLLLKPDKESLEYAKEHSLLFLYSKTKNPMNIAQEEWELLQTVLIFQHGICTPSQMEKLLKFSSFLSIKPERIVLRGTEEYREQLTNRYVVGPIDNALWLLIGYRYETFDELFEAQGRQTAERLFSLIEEISKKEELQFYFRDEKEDEEASIIYGEVEKKLPNGEHLFENPFVGVALTGVYLYFYKRNLNRKLDEIYPERKKERY